jgi:predicted PurR-regulated permease PerM
LPPHLVSIAVVAVFVALLAVLVPDVLFAIIAGVLLAILVSRGSHWLARRLALPQGLAILVLLVLVGSVLVGAGAAAAPEIGSQFDQLVRRVPAAVASLRATVEQFPLAQRLLNYLTSEGVLWSGGLMATTAFTTTFGAIGTFVVICSLASTARFSRKPTAGRS